MNFDEKLKEFIKTMFLNTVLYDRNIILRRLRETLAIANVSMSDDFLTLIVEFDQTHIINLAWNAYSNNSYKLVDIY